ncbi:MAG: type II toxin-antitoxin system RelE/ParE family toxin [Candidatus Omnitrophota bacterium]|nr:type II toxin-antitoxin system RelE/ParE family toxin [Candidatus Omnitrophota bacterium]
MRHRLSGIYYFIDKRGNTPVEEFLNTLTVKEKGKIFAYLIELQEQGCNLRRPMADYLGDGIYELRPKDNRIFYFFFLNDTAVLVHAIKKKTGKIPENDLRLCIDRKIQAETYKNIIKIEL